MNNMSYRIKPIALILITVGLIISAFTWFATHSYLTININGQNGPIDYILINQENGKSTEFTSSENPIKRLVSTGNYEVRAAAKNANYIEVTKTSRFLATTEVQGSLRTERSRKFVGDNPSSCLFYSNILLSYGCGDAFRNAMIHTPANVNLPTLTQHVKTDLYGSIEGIIFTSEGNLLLSQATSGSGPHTLFTLTPDFTVTNPILLKDLHQNENYTIAKYEQGFIVYNQDFTHALYFSSRQSKASAIKHTVPSDHSYSVYSQSVNGDKLVAAYTNLEDTNNQSKKTQAQTLVIIDNPTRTDQYTFNNQYASVVACGKNKLCLLANKTLEIYDVSTAKQNLLYKVTGVDSQHSLGDTLLISRNNDIVEFDVEKQSGYASYRSTNYSVCGLQTDTTGFTLCLINSLQKKVALHIDRGSVDVDSIDQKIAELMKLPEILSLSVYDNLIYIVPNLGSPVYDNTTNTFGFDSGTQKRVNLAIQSEINKLNINRNKYKIINTGE